MGENRPAKAKRFKTSIVATITIDRGNGRRMDRDFARRRFAHSVIPIPLQDIYVRKKK